MPLLLSVAAVFLAACITVAAASGGTVKDDAVFFGDIEVGLAKNAVGNVHMRWPNGEVPFYISSGLASGVKRKILTAMEIIKSSVNGAETCINFVPRTTQHNYVEIYQGTGCHSNVGMENRGRQTVSIGLGCEYKGIILHELLHTLGFYHEHSRSDRDDHVKVDSSNIKTGNSVNFEKMSLGEMTLLQTPYDLESIMNYDPYTLASDPSKPVMVPEPDMAERVFQMGQRMALSDMDVLRIQRLYSCPEDTSHIVRVEKDHELLACNFQDDLCGMADHGGDFSWAVRTGPSPAGPWAGHSTGTDKYLVATAAGHSGQSAKIKTPLSAQGGTCVDFYLFMGHSSSKFSLEVSGPSFSNTKLPFSVSANGYNKWVRYQTKVNLPVGFAMQVTFKATMGTGDVALDDVRLYTGSCN